VIRAAVVACLICSLFPAVAFADEPFVCPNPDVKLGLAGCEVSAEQLHVMIQDAVGSSIRYRVEAMCIEMQQQPVCINPVECVTPPNSYRYHVSRSEDVGATWEEVASVCLGEDDTDSLRVITQIRILREFKRIAWPQADLVIQPPDGRTLINLPTNFFTTTTESTSQTVSLLGQTVEIEATPVNYTWHFGDGVSQEGADPGAEYPDLRITHIYVEADVTVSPGVDVTYQGRYSVNGGPWQDIPERLTVNGTPVELRVLSATPHLVG
jgi:hypothetical protein